ncbi:DNA polymerase III, alpha subunit [Enterococcus haemoperoxidus ATCC BAA-382]|uniref:DNA polymerase III subunit alpha n=1 Tax=Enterococcus haemoperoxidus ATCC BAA-382 TaxID=1158608 RepID=R2T453_9ENTE|nr:DNA polymerase III subunit alpha [Enterococcus haemoperoxidus]EOH99781.1 DNA polymerase III, alpha subunit [Enterococcus haemoperoxidus ATCC BAA-382]EOT62477.1 DNA polymerase III, alpha subunit [Enterococcus haemoperoxidus ATCC BAA-382]OJG54333.1 DNA polymerase III, alpha subunit [Enterococcus haemoperoxidus]
MPFPQLYTITSYSLLSSTIRIQELVQQAKKLGYTTLGITDINVLHGAIEFFEVCKKEAIKPIIGLTLDYTPKKSEQSAQLLLYAKDIEGYQNLMRISTAKMNSERIFYLDAIKEHLTHLFAVMPSDKGEVSFALKRNEVEASESLDQLVQLFDPSSFFAGASFTCNPETDPALFKFYEAKNQPLLALQETRYLNREDGFALKVLAHIDEGQQMTLNAEETKIEGPFYLRNQTDAAEQLLIKVNEQAVQNAEKLADSCILEIPLHQRLLPHYPIPEGKQAGEFLKELCLKKLPERISNVSVEYEERLVKELDIIHTMGFDDYFLIVWDVMAFAHDRKIVTGAGRGSAAGSLVSYVLSITDVDPIKYDLLFERFLNPERHSMPDIDLDIPDNRREEVLQYVREKYGHYHMAQIATFGTMAAKMVLRDVARVFGLSQSESNRWSNAVPSALKMTLKTAYADSKNLVELVNSSETNRLLYDTAVRLEGLPRHVSTHAAGVVISDLDLLDVVPLQPGSNDIFLTQFTMNDVEKIGLLKMDFLGLRNLSIIDDTIKSIKRVYKKEVILNQIPLDDELTLSLFRRGETSGVFQFESAGIRNVLRKLGPSSIEDIAAVNALYRPGPMQNIDLFIRRKKGIEPIDYPDPVLEPILKNTYGVIVYQEQIIQVASTMAGFSLGQADILRRAVSKKKKDVLDEERKHFVEGAMKQGHSEEVATTIYDYIERFANYGFNRSHAFAYSFIGFQMAYLKVHFPGAFYAAILHSVRHNPTKIKEYIGEARKNKMAIIQPSINTSQYSFYLNNDDQITFGFSSLKGIRRDFIQNIIEERKERGPFKSFDQFLLRIDRKWLKAENIQPLIAIGAFDELQSNRRQLAVSLDSEIQNIIYSGGSMNLLEDTLKLKEVEVADYTLEEKLEQEEQFLGVYLSGHPTEEFKKTRLAKQVMLVSDVVENQAARLLIYVKDIRVIRTKKGEQMAFVEGDDLTGAISLTLFPTVFRTLRQNVEKNQVYFVEGKIEKSNYNQELQLLVNQIEKASEIENSISATTCYLKIIEAKDQKEVLQSIHEVIQKHKGNTPVIIYFEKNGKKLVLGEENWVTDTVDAKEQLEAILGGQNVVFK